MTYDIHTIWSSLINNDANTILKQYSRLLFTHYKFIIVRLHYVDEIGVVCQHNTGYVFKNSVSDGFYLDENDSYIFHDTITSKQYYNLGCIVEIDETYIHYIVFRKHIQPNETITTAISSLFAHYQSLSNTTSIKIYLLVPIPPYANHHQMTSYFLKI